MGTIICLRCKHPNGDTRHLCSECNAKLPFLREGAKIFESYQIGRQLDQNQLSTAFFATDRKGTPCIIREIIPPVVDAEVNRRFTAVAQALKKLKSPHVPSFQAPTKEGHFFIIEYVEGRTLADELRERGKFSEDEALEILNALLDVLEELHANSVFHGDITPENVLRRKENGPLVLFNFAVLRDAIQGTNSLGQALPAPESLPPYVPQERKMGTLGPTSDIYTTGLTTLCLISGKQPREAYDSFYDPHSNTWDLDQLSINTPFKTALKSMLNPSPAGRFQNVQGVRRALLPVALRPCSRPGCQGKLQESEKYCPDCGAEFERGWLERWAKETVRPQLEADVVEALSNKSRLLGPMIELGLILPKLEDAWREEIRRLGGNTERELNQWISNQVIEPLESPPTIQKKKISPEQSNRILKAAASSGIRPHLAQKILDRELAKRGVQVESKTFYCPVPRCGCSFAYKDLKYCPKSGKPLVESSIKLWLDKFVRPALEDDLLTALEKKGELLARAKDLELSETETGTAFANEVKKITGATDDVLEDWIETYVRPALDQDVVTNEERNQILKEAEQSGISRVIAKRIVNQLLPLLGINATEIDFGSLKSGDKRTRRINVINAGSGRLRGKVQWSASWIVVHPATLDPEKSEQTIEIRIDTAGLQAGSEQSGILTFETSGGVEAIPVHVTIKPSRPWMLPVTIVATLLISVVIARSLVPRSKTPPLDVTLVADQTTVELGGKVRLDALVKQAGAGSLRFAWNSTGGRIEGDGPEVKLDTSDITVSNQNRSINVSVTVTDSQGATRSSQQTIFVTPKTVQQQPTDVVTPTPPPPQPTNPPVKRPLPSLATLTLIVNVDGVDVSVDGRSVGKVSRSQRKQVQFPSGRHKITATKNGYEVWEREVDLPLNPPDPVTIIMQPRDIRPPEKTPSELAREHYMRAEQLIADRNFDGAEHECIKGLNLDPNNQALKDQKKRIEKIKGILDRPNRPSSPDHENPPQQERPVSPPAGDSTVSLEPFVPAVVIHRVYPSYPPVARQARVAGIVTVEVTVDPQGNVTAARVIDGHPLLHQSALDAAKQLRFRPARRGAQPVSDTVKIGFEFKLN
jgi:TonB family protein